MSLDSEPVSEDEQQHSIELGLELGLELEQTHHDAPAFHPPPPDELFEISTTVDPSYVISLIRKLLPLNVTGGERRDEELHLRVCNDKAESMDVDENGDSSIRVGESEERHRLEGKEKEEEEVWEECGCILWDLAANKTHAELMVQNLILDVILVNLSVSKSLRVTEICIGIVGNLACHESTMKQIVSTNGLTQIIMNQLFLDDTRCLCEACRLLTLGLQSSEFITWAKQLHTAQILARILWIAENTLNPQLIEKSIGLLLAILESQNEAASLLITPLVKLGLPCILIKSFAFEMNKLISEKVPERYPALDVILQAIEALSVMDNYSEEISTNKELFRLVCELVKLPDKIEVANLCVTASILIANILSDVPDLAFEISQDLSFVQGLFDIFAFTSDDSESRGALWSTIARILVRVRETEISRTSLHQYVSVLVDKADFIEEDLLDNQLDDPDRRSENQSNVTRLNARMTALKRIASILNEWTRSGEYAKESNEIENELAITKLLECCKRYTE